MKNTINIFLIIGGLNGHGAWHHNRPLKKNANHRDHTS